MKVTILEFPGHLLKAVSEMLHAAHADTKRQRMIYLISADNIASRAAIPDPVE